MSLIKANQKKSKELTPIVQEQKPELNGVEQKPYNLLVSWEKLKEFDQLTFNMPHGMVMQLVAWIHSCEKQEIKA